MSRFSALPLSALRAATLFLFFVVLFLFAASPAAYAAESGRIVVKFKNSADSVQPTRSAPFVRELSLQHKFSLPEIGYAVFIVPEGKDVDSVLSTIRGREGVALAERDGIATAQFIPNDPCYTGSPCAQSSWYFPLANFPSAWDITSGAGVTIAVLDTGVNCATQDMAGQCVTGRNVVNNTNISSSVNSDDVGHGTWVASVAAAIGNNGVQITGAAFGAKVMPIKINQPGENFAFFSDMADGVLWANSRGVKIVNLSFCSTSGPDQVLKDAATMLQSNGGIVFECAGNEGVALTYSNPSSIVTVGATNQSDQLASFPAICSTCASNTGAAIDLTAPGIPINAVGSNGGVWSVYGTSFATPLASGVAALMKSANSSLTGAQIESIMESNAVDLGAAGRDNSFGWGRINAGASVAAAGGGGDTTPPSAPTNLTATPSSTQVVLSWTASTDNVGITGYNVYRCTGTCTPTSVIASPTSNSYTDTTVSAGSTYSYLVKARDAAGNVSTGSNTVTTTVPSGGGDTTPPSAPTGLTATSITKTQVALSWTASTDNVGVTGYRVYRCLGATCTPSTQIGTSAITSFTDTTVSGRKTYNYTVKAFDAAGNLSGASNKLKVITPR